MLKMENNCEKWRCRTQIVALVDIGFLFIQAIIFMGALLAGLLMVALMPKTLEVFIILVVTTFVIIVFEFYATIRLISASNKDTNVSTDKLIWSTRLWYYLNIVLLFIVIIFELFTFHKQPIWALAVGVIFVFIRVIMLWTVRMYLKALEERSAEGANIELENVYALSSSMERNEVQLNQVDSV